MTKHKSVIAVLLSVMIVFTFMPTMAFAAVDTPAKFNATMADGSAVQGGPFATYDEAFSRIDKGGTVTATEGVIANDISVVDGGLDNFKIDVTAATFTNGSKVKVNDTETYCLVETETGKFSFHKEHSWENPVVTPKTTDSSTAVVTVRCSNGHNYDVQEVPATSSTTSGGYVTYTATLTHPTTLTAAQKSISWKVAESEATDVYAVDTVDYRKDGENLALLDAEGKVQFFTSYKKNGTKVTNVDGTDATLVGEIVEKKAPTNDKATPTTTEYGYHNYDVKFKFPNNQYSSVVTVENVKDQAKAAPTKDGAEIQYLFKDANGNEFWGTYNANCTQDTEGFYAPFTFVTNYGTASAAQSDTETTGAVKFNLVIASDGNLTCRVKYTSTEDPSYAEYGEAAQTTLDTTGTAGVDATKVYDCGKKFYLYNNVTGTYKSGSNIKNYTFAVDNVTINSTHDYDKYETWAKVFTVDTSAGHDHTGTATAECKYCGETWNSNSYVIPKSTNHEFLKDSSGAEVVKTVAPTCKDYGFQYKICKVNDGGWISGKYTLVLDQATNKTYTFTKQSDFNVGTEASPVYGHPVLVAGSVKEKVAHDTVVVSSASVAWDSTAASVEAAKLTDDVYASATVGCRNCEQTLGTYVFHSLSFADAKKLAAYSGAQWKLDKDSENTVTLANGEKHIFGSVKVEPTEAADCSKFDTFTYTVQGMTLANGGAITKTVTSSVYSGPHTYTNKVVFSEDGKTADVLQICEKTGCLSQIDVKNNKKSQEKKAVVTATENTDGSTTYTATLEGFELKDNTKTIFDLTKAEIVVNEGKEVDLNNYDAAAIAKLVVVKINGSEISKDLYDVAIGTLKVGEVSVTVTAKAVSTGVASNGKKDGKFNCIKPAKFIDLKVRCDNKLYGSSDYKSTFTYDGTTHVVTAVAQDQKGDVKDATVKFYVVKGGSYTIVDENTTIIYDADGDKVDTTKVSFDLDKVEFTDAGTYLVLAKVTKEGYTDKYYIADTYIVNQIKVKKPIVVQAQYIKYGEQLVATTGDAELDKTIGLEVKDTTKLGVGEYLAKELIKTNGNYNVSIEGIGLYSTVYIEKRSAKVILKDVTKTYDGKELDPATLYTVDGALEGDDLNVLVNTYGDNKIAVEPGTYILVATANNANYTIEVVTATLKINKKAQKVKSITPSKKTYKASKKTGKLAKNKTFNLKAKTSGTSAAKVTFSKVSGNKKFTVTKAGKVTVKKGLKKGTYTLKVKATKAATKHYAKATKTKSIKIVVK
jgi:hypothetical protein